MILLMKKERAVARLIWGIRWRSKLPEKASRNVLMSCSASLWFNLDVIEMDLSWRDCQLLLETDYITVLKCNTAHIVGCPLTTGRDFAFWSFGPSKFEFDVRLKVGLSRKELVLSYRLCDSCWQLVDGASPRITLRTIHSAQVSVLWHNIKWRIRTPRKHICCGLECLGVDMLTS